MKRIISLIIVFSLCLSLCAFADEGVLLISAPAKEVKYEDELEFIKKIGIADSQVLSNDYITRGAFTSLVINVLYPDNVFDGEYDTDALFSDVDESHIYYPEIKAARSMGFIKGSNEAQFRPDENIAYTDAVTVLVNALGYGYLAAANGGYPTGYLAAAKNINLSKGISNGSGELSGDVAAKLIYNALFVESVDFSSVDGEGNIGITIKPDENLLLKKYSIYKYDAKVIATPLSAVEGEASSEGTVVLKISEDEQITVWSVDSGIERELGKKLTVYIKKDTDSDKEEVVFYNDYKKMKITVLNGDDIINVTSSYIEYEGIDESFKKISTEAYPDVLYNGVMLTQYNNDTLKPANGFVTFIDTDGNGKAETLSVVSFSYSGMIKDIPSNNNPAYNIVVDSVNTEKMYISCKWNPSNNLDLDEDKVIYTVISKDGTINKLTDIEKNDIVSVAKAPAKTDGKDVYFLYVERKNVKDIYDSVNTSENSIELNGTEYKVSSSLYSVKPGYYSNMVSGSDISVYLDYTNKIAYIENIKKVANNYSYIISAAVKKSGVEDILVLKVLEYTNTVNIYNVSLKAKIDGKKYSTAKAQYEAIEARPANYTKWTDDGGTPYENRISRPAIIKLDNSKNIISINTDNPDYTTIPEKVNAGLLSVGEEKNIYTDFNSIGYSNEEVGDSLTLKAGLRVPRVGAYRTKKSTVEGRFFINSETYVFSVPEIDTCGLSDYQNYASNPAYSYAAPDYKIIKLFENEKVDSNYKVVLTSTLEDGVLYDIQAYNVDPDTGVAEMVILRGANGINGEETGEETAIFLRKTEYFKPASETAMTKIYYTIDGEKELSAIVDTDNLFLPYDYIIRGRKATDEDNIYGVDIPQLKKGDFIRVTVNGEMLSSIQRLVILDELETKTLGSFQYGRKATGYQASDANRRLFDVNTTNWGGNASTYNNFVLIPEKVKGSLVHGIMSGTTAKKYFLSDINVNDPSTYISQVIDFNGMNPVLVTVTKKADGTIKDVKVTSGSVNDIVTFDDAESFKTASRIIFKHTDFVVSNMFIVNYEIVE